MAERDPLSLIGKTLAGHFLVESLTGEGRFSIVYRGQHIGPKEPVALKCLKLGLELDATGAETFLKRFREENKTNSRVSKGNALFVRSIGSGMTTSDAGQHVPYTVLEWLDGHSLAAELATRRTQGATGRPLSEALTLLGPAISALGHAHDSDVAHGDLSPGSFFLTGGETKILDLGVAKLVSDLSREIDPSVTHARIFSPQYGAPEHFDSRLGEFGPWTDVYGLALVLLELLRDRPAVEIIGAGSIRDQSAVVLDPQKRPTPRALGLRVGDAVQKVMSRAVALVARERYPSAGDFLDALKTAMEKDVAAPAANGKIDEYSPADDESDTLVKPPGAEKAGEKPAVADLRPAAGAAGVAVVAHAHAAHAHAAKPAPKPPGATLSTPAPAVAASASPAAVLPSPPTGLSPNAPAAVAVLRPVPAAPKPTPAPPVSFAATTKMAVAPAARISTPAGRPSAPAPPAPASNPGLVAAVAPAHSPPPPPAPPPPAPPPVHVAPAPPPPPPVQVAPAPPPPVTTGISDNAKNVRDVIPPAPTNIPVGDLPSIIIDDPEVMQSNEQRRQDQVLRSRETVRLDIRPGAPAWMPQPPTPPGSNPGLPVAPAAVSSPGALPIVALQDRTDGGGRPAMGYEARRARSRSRLIIVAFVSFLVVFLAGATILGVHWFLAARGESAPAPTSTSP